jgi:precorrin-3B methylase
MRGGHQPIPPREDSPVTDHDTQPAPRTAAEAARQLADEGKHVHLVSDGDTTCVSKDCQP